MNHVRFATLCSSLSMLGVFGCHAHARVSVKTANEPAYTEDANKRQAYIYKKEESTIIFIKELPKQGILYEPFPCREALLRVVIVYNRKKNEEVASIWTKDTWPQIVSEYQITDFEVRDAEFCVVGQGDDSRVDLYISKPVVISEKEMRELVIDVFGENIWESGSGGSENSTVPEQIASSTT